MTLQDEFGPYLTEALKDPVFRLAYMRASAQDRRPRAPIKRNRKRGWRRT